MENVKDTQKNIDIIKDTKEKITVVGEGVTLFERLLSLSKQYSLWDIIKTLLIAIMVVYTGFMMLNPTYLFEKYNEMMADKHKMELTERFTQSRLVSSELAIIMNKLHADRAFFIEYHNSVKSLQGAPFAYGSMDFEEVSDGIDYIGDEYTNFSLTKYKFVSFLSDNLLFIGNVEDIEPIDKRLSLKLMSNEVKQIALIEVEGTEHPLGVLGVSWTKHDVVEEYYNEIKKEMRSGAIRLALILDNKKNENNKSNEIKRNNNI